MLYKLFLPNVSLFSSRWENLRRTVTLLPTSGTRLAKLRAMLLKNPEECALAQCISLHQHKRACNMKSKGKIRRTWRRPWTWLRGVLWNKAVKLKEKFGKHSKQYYYEQIIHASKHKKGKGKILRWNIYLSLEVKCINKGKFFCNINYSHVKYLPQDKPADQQKKACKVINII